MRAGTTISRKTAFCIVFASSSSVMIRRNYFWRFVAILSALADAYALL